MKIKLLSFIFLSFITGYTFAQCPYGMPNNPGCVPPDAWPQNQSGQSVQQSRSYWVYTWGALAADKATVGASTGHDTKRQAEKAAIKDCRNRGGTKDCKVLIAYHHQCVAAAYGKGFSWSHGPDLDEVKRKSIDACNDLSGDGECSIYYANCTEPYLVR